MRKERRSEKTKKADDLMDTSPTHTMGLTGFWPRRRVEKNPQPSRGRLGISPAHTLHSLILEDLT